MLGQLVVHRCSTGENSLNRIFRFIQKWSFFMTTGFLSRVKAVGLEASTVAKSSDLTMEVR